MAFSNVLHLISIQQLGQEIKCAERHRLHACFDNAVLRNENDQSYDCSFQKNSLQIQP